MSKLRRCLTLWVTISCLIWPLARLGQAEDQVDSTYQSTIYLLRKSMQVHRDGGHNRMLAALRSLEDPALTPIFTALLQKDRPVLKIHGLLGLAQIDPQSEIDLTRVVSLVDRYTQSQALSAALDGGLLSDEQAQQLLQSQGIDQGVKVVLATRLVGKGKFADVDMLKEAAKSTILARRSLAALALLQLGEAGAIEQLRELDKSMEPQRDQIRQLLLRTGLRCEYDRAGPWAAEICRESAIVPGLSIPALRIALQFGAPDAAQIWREQFELAIDPALRTRLALTALSVSPYVEPELYDALSSVDEPILKQIGATGAAVASKTRVAEGVVQLIDMLHPRANQWALAYARNDATDQDAKRILLALILAIEQVPEGSVTRHLSAAMRATGTLFELDPDHTDELLRPKLNDPKTDPRLVQVILRGLIWATKGEPWRMVDGLAPFAHPPSNQLAVLLLAKHGQTLTQDQMQDLRAIVRGGGGMSISLRVQAAWAYLKFTDQVDKALNEVVGAHEYHSAQSTGYHAARD